MYAWRGDCTLQYSDFCKMKKFNKGHRKEDVSEGENKMSVEPWNPSNEVF